MFTTYRETSNITEYTAAPRYYLWLQDVGEVVLEAKQVHRNRMLSGMVLEYRSQETLRDTAEQTVQVNLWLKPLTFEPKYHLIPQVSASRSYYLVPVERRRPAGRTRRGFHVLATVRRISHAIAGLSSTSPEV